MLYINVLTVVALTGSPRGTGRLIAAR